MAYQVTFTLVPSNLIPMEGDLMEVGGHSYRVADIVTYYEEDCGGYLNQVPVGDSGDVLMKVILHCAHPNRKDEDWHSEIKHDCPDCGKSWTTSRMF